MYSYPEKERKSPSFIIEHDSRLNQQRKAPMRHISNFIHLTEQKPTPKTIHFKTQRFFVIELSPPIRSKRLKRSLWRAKIIQRLMIDLSLGFKFTQRILRLLQTFKIRQLEVTIKHPSYMYSENFGPLLKMLRNKKIEAFGLYISIPLDIIATLMAMHYRNFAIFKDNHLESILKKIAGLPRLSVLKLHFLSESFIFLTNRTLLNLSHTLSRKKSLKVLDLNCPLKEVSEEPYAEFASTIEDQTQLLVLSLNFTGLRKLDADILMNSISKLNNIRSLCLSTDQALDEDDTKSLANCCQSLTNLERLQLTYFPAHRNAYNIYFSDTLEKQRKLKDLHLTMYSANEEESYNLASSLKALIRLRTLNLSFFLGTFTRRVTENFSGALSSIAELNYVSLKFSQCKILGLKSLMSSFQSLNDLRTLNLQFLHIADAFLEEYLFRLLHSLFDVTSLTCFALVLTGNITINFKSCIPYVAAFINTHDALMDFKIDLPKSSYLEVQKNNLKALLKKQKIKQMNSFQLLSDGNIFQNY